MINPQKILLLLSLFFLLACKTNKETNTSHTLAERKITANYKKAEFFINDRLEKIAELKSDIDQIFEDYSKERNIPGIAYGIVVDDSLVISSAVGLAKVENKIPASPATAFRIASMTKSFTAMAIIKLRDEGKLSLGDPVSKYIPASDSTAYLTTDAPAIDIENLLTMTAGFPEDNPWGDRQLALTEEEMDELISAGFSMSNIPSITYEYSNTGYALLGRIISKITNQPYQDYIQTEILQPLGMNDTYWEYADVPDDQLASGYRWEDEKWKPEPLLHDGAYGAMGGLITSIEDFSRYVSFHLSAWPPRNDEENGPLKRSSIREMHTPQHSYLNTWNKDWANEPCASLVGYGYGLRAMMDCKQYKRVGHGGALPGFGSNYEFFPDYGIGIMAFGNLTYTRPIPYDKIEKLIFNKQMILKRELPPSDVLQEKKDELLSLITADKVRLDSDIFAENFFLDRSQERREKEIEEIKSKAGDFKNYSTFRATNQLRGGLSIECENGTIGIFFTLTPERNPKIQQLNLSFMSEVKD